MGGSPDGPARYGHLPAPDRPARYGHLPAPDRPARYGHLPALDRLARYGHLPAPDRPACYGHLPAPNPPGHCPGLLLPTSHLPTPTLIWRCPDPSRHHVHAACPCPPDPDPSPPYPDPDPFPPDPDPGRHHVRCLSIPPDPDALIYPPTPRHQVFRHGAAAQASVWARPRAAPAAAAYGTGGAHRKGGRQGHAHAHVYTHACKLMPPPPQKGFRF